MDIAKIGFSAPTGPLKDAKAALHELKPAAEQAAAGVGKFNAAAAGVTKGTGGASAGIKSFQAAATGAAGTTDRLTKAALSAGTAMGTIQRTAAGVKPTLDLVTAGAQRQISLMDVLSAKWHAFVDSLQRVPAAAGGATTSLSRMGRAANDNINAMQATPGNIAAQFQDIGVTAAAGMSPMLIALQQGTQLSAAMSGGIGNLMAGFAQLFSVTTILTIGLVGLAAAGLQMVDWISVGQTVLYGLADAMEAVALGAVYMGGVLAIAFAPQIITWIGTTTAMLIGGLLTAIKSVTAAMIAFAVANPFGFIVLAIGAAIAAMILLNDTFGGVFTDILAWVKKGANFIIGALVGAFNSVKAVWKQLPAAIGDYVIQAANWTLRTVENMVNGTISLINGMTASLPFGLGDGLQMGDVSFGQIDNPLAGAADAVNATVSAEMGKAQGVDYVQGIVDGVSSAAGWAADKLRGFADGLGLSPDKDKKGRTARAAGGKTDAEKYADIVKGINAEIAALRVESKALDMSANAAALYRNEQKLLAEAMQQGINLTAAQTQELMGLAAVLTDAQMEVAFKQQLKGIEDQMRALKDANALIGLRGVQLEYEKNRQELMNQAIANNTIKLDENSEATRLQIAMLENRAMALAKQSGVNADAEMIASATKAHEENMLALRREAGELNLTGKALETYRLETELLVEAERGVASPETIALLRQQGIEYINLADSVAKTREETEFYRDTHRSFFAEMIGGLRQGQSVWEAFGNAVMSVVNRIIDRLLNMNGGVLDKLVNLGMSVLGLAAPQARLLGDVNSTIGANPELFAKGGAFGVEKFARGGEFTNGIYDRPTLFKFAGGGALGQMGEAGPEAVMPLKRGPNGSLGVQMHGPQTVHVQIGVNDDRFNAYVDDRADIRVANAAPVIANGGAQVANRTAAYKHSRRIGS